MKKITLLLLLVFLAAGTTFGQCIATSPFLTVNSNNSGNVQNISGCNYGGEYNTVNGLLTGVNYRFTSSAPSLTITDASNNVLGFGTSPVTINAIGVTTVRVHTHSSPAPTCGTAATCFSTAIQRLFPVPSNDLCANAINIGSDGTIAGTTLGSTVDNAGTCNTVTNTIPGVWYSFTDPTGAGVGSTVTLNTCSTVGYDTKLSVYTGSCGVFTCVTANDDAGAACSISGVRSEVSFTTDGTSTYYVLVHGFSGTGNFELNVSGLPTLGEPPVIACPMDIVANNDPTVCTANVNFANALAIDVEDGPLTTTQTMGPTSGSAFPLGDTIVEFSVTDSDGNTATCQFTVTVVDNELPIAICQNLTLDLDPVTGTVSITGEDVDNGSTDNCGIATYALDVSSFDCSNIGDNPVTLTITDNSGNVSTCASTITIQDVTAPEIVCIGGFGTFTETEDFEAATIPVGWTTTIEAGTDDWTFGSGDLPTGDDFPTNAAIFDDDAAGSGQTNAATLISPVYDLTGASNVTLGYDVAFQEFGDQTFTVEVFDGSAWQQVAFYDASLDPDIQTESFDVSAYANPAFQVRYVYDDLGGWGWAAGVDNFSLSYEASTGEGLDVFLDADGMASIDPNDLLVNVNEACSYTITAGGAGGGTMGSLTTLFTSNNGGSAGWTVMYDLTVGPNDIEVTDLDVNIDGTSTFNLDMYTLEGTYIGNETNPGAWGAPAASGTGTGLGIDQPSNAVLTAPVTLLANTTYGIAIVTDSGQNYTNGTGSNQNYSNPDLSVSLGAAVSGLFTGSVFTPRIFNGTINYTVSNGTGLDFTCADLGENLVEVTVTDASGNSATCIAVVNVIDLVAPVITCGPDPSISATVSDSPALAIPDNDPVGVTSTLTVTEDFTIEDLDVNLDITHTWVGDLITTITSPAGTSVIIVDRIGGTGTGVGCSGDDILATLDDAATSPIEGVCGSGVPSIDGTFSPNNPLSAFNGESTLGDWTITISDNAGGDTGTLNSWGLTYSYANTNTDVIIELGPDGTATVDPYAIINNVIEACGISTAAVDVSEVSCADIGTPLTITAFVSDTSGNIASCSATVIVVDNLAPVITCPADQTVDPGVGNLFYILPDYIATGEATAIDNCTDPVTITTQDPAPGTALSDGDYTITLTATDEYGNTSTCSFVLTVESILGTNDNSLETGIALYPNPATNVVNLVNKTNVSLEKMVIFDINGKRISQIDLRGMQSEKAVDVSSLSSGVYVIQIIGDKSSTVKRLIKE